MVRIDQIFEQSLSIGEYKADLLGLRGEFIGVPLYRQYQATSSCHHFGVMQCKQSMAPSYI
ncbi:hypothetical protein F443_10446 [Phytophthora nicotianae P1569]|uniref:Uncharacterized protein n=1 Tax=Phytophthora nicotianae P1569 TaxID=1317065 RepID=V9F1E6_PHYNI|nr:hypothetical protein F443_10446 [Phytophthora nicotianae P1569]